MDNGVAWRVCPRKAKWQLFFFLIPIIMILFSLFDEERRRATYVHKVLYGTIVVNKNIIISTIRPSSTIPTDRAAIG